MRRRPARLGCSPSRRRACLRSCEGSHENADRAASKSRTTISLRRSVQHFEFVANGNGSGADPKQNHAAYPKQHRFRHVGRNDLDANVPAFAAGSFVHPLSILHRQAWRNLSGLVFHAGIRATARAVSRLVIFGIDPSAKPTRKATSVSPDCRERLRTATHRARGRRWRVVGGLFVVLRLSR